MAPTAFEPAFCVDSPFGRCVAVHLPNAAEAGSGLALLHTAEQAFARSLAPLRQVTWMGGRIALRRALSGVAPADGPILATPRGAPSLPAGAVGSISHKRTTAIAIAAQGEGFTLGLDLEETARRPVDIAARILVGSELRELEGLPEGDRWREVLLRFSLKEAVYKAIDPFVQRYVAFAEAVVEPSADGCAQVRLMLRGGEGPFALAAWWTIRNGFIVSVVCARRAG